MDGIQRLTKQTGSKSLPIGYTLIYPKENEAEQNNGKKLIPSFLIFFGVLILQIIFGAFTAGYVEGDSAKVRPGHIFNTWPKMGDEWVAEQVFMRDGFYANIFENASGIQFAHRTIALLLVVSMVFVWVKSNKLTLTKTQYNGVTFLIYGLTIQFILGVLTLIYQVPVIMGALHQTGAFFLFAVSIFMMFHLFKKQA